jgi:DNA invertase Pin-like site-specific DNA recombinase
MDIELIPEPPLDDCRWPIRPPLIEGELLSSWICRVAIANGTSPAAMFDVIDREAGPTGKVWPDNPSMEVAAYLHRWADQPMDAILRAAPVMPSRLIARDDVLGRFVSACPRALLRAAHVNSKDNDEPTLATAPIVYCPLCLKADEVPFIRRTWRARLATGCETHGVRLLHSCPHCQAYVKPHQARHNDGLCFCHQCGKDIRKSKPATSTAREKADVADTLTFLDAVLGAAQFDEIAERGERLIRRAVDVINGESNFWHLYFAPNEIGGGLEWARRPATEWRNAQATNWGKERLEGAETGWGHERVVPWNGEIPIEVGTGRMIGYANRFSDGDSSLDRMLDRQIGALRLVGVSDMLIFVDDHHVGSSVDIRLGLRAAMAAAKIGDTLVVAGLEFLGRSTEETMTTIARIRKSGLHLWVLDSQMHTGSATGHALLDVVEMLEAAQRRRHVVWSKAVIMEGVLGGKSHFGKKPITRERLLEGGRLLLAGMALKSISDQSGIPRTTIVKHRHTMLTLAKQEQDEMEEVE